MGDALHTAGAVFGLLSLTCFYEALSTSKQPVMRASATYSSAVFLEDLSFSSLNITVAFLLLEQTEHDDCTRQLRKVKGGGE